MILPLPEVSVYPRPTTEPRDGRGGPAHAPHTNSTCAFPKEQNMKVMTIFGTRPEMIKMWSTLKKLD